MVSKNIYKKVAVSFVAAGFLISGASALVNDEITDFVLKNANITGNANSNTTIATFTANATTSLSNFILTFNSTSSYVGATRRDVSVTNGLSVEIVDSSGNVKSTVTNNPNSDFTFSSVTGLTANATYSIRVNPQVAGTEGRVSLTSVKDNSVAESSFTTTTNTIDLITLPMLDSVSAQSSSSLRLSYSYTGSKSLHYLVYQGTSSTAQETLRNSGAYVTSTSSFDDTSLSASNSYYYKVCASVNDITSTNAYSVLCSTANSGTTSSSYVATSTVTDLGKVDVPDDAITTTTGNTETSTVTTSTGTSTTTVNGDTGTTTSTVTTTDGTTTTINSETEVESVMNENGSVTQFAVLSDNSNAEKVEVTANTDGTANASVTSKSGAIVKVDIPAGSDTVISKDGSITSNVQVDSSVSGKVDVEIKIDATTGKSSATVSQVVTINGQEVTQTFTVVDYDGTTESITEFIKASNLRAVDGNSGGIKKTFKSTRSFFASKAAESRATDYSEAKTVEIVPTTQWQKFEEIVLYSGKRSLTLLAGGADIVIDGDRNAMEKDIEYLLPLNIEEVDATTDTTNETSYTDGKLSLSTNWNLVALPVDTTVDDLSIFGDYSTSWKYSDKKWTQNPATLNKAEGIWFKMNSANEVEFTGDAYEPIVADLGTGWSLIGTGMELTNFKSNNSLEALWTFQNAKWTSNPETIYAGQGFWIKK